METIRLPDAYVVGDLVRQRPKKKKKKSVTLESLRNLASGSAKRKTFEFLHFLEALEDCKCS